MSLKSISFQLTRTVCEGPLHDTLMKGPKVETLLVGAAYAAYNNNDRAFKACIARAKELIGKLPEADRPSIDISKLESQQYLSLVVEKIISKVALQTASSFEANRIGAISASSGLNGFDIVCNPQTSFWVRNGVGGYNPDDPIVKDTPGCCKRDPKSTSDDPEYRAAFVRASEEQSKRVQKRRADMGVATTDFLMGIGEEGEEFTNTPVAPVLCGRESERSTDDFESRASAAKAADARSKRIKERSKGMLAPTTDYLLGYGEEGEELSSDKRQ